MKKAIVLAAVAVMAAMGANAQSFQWGAKAGLNQAWQTEFSEPMGLSGGMKTKERTGLYAGLFAERALGKRFGVQGELLYMQLGMSGKTGNHTYGTKTDYIVLPVLAKVYVLRRLSVDLGPQLGYMLSANGVGGSKHDDLSYLDKFDMSIAAGLSCTIAGRYDVSARYNIGLTKLSDHSEAKNGSLSLGVGYRF